MLKGQKKHIDKEHGKTKHEAPRSVNYRATQNKNNIGKTATETQIVVYNPVSMAFLGQTVFSLCTCTRYANAFKHINGMVVLNENIMKHSSYDENYGLSKNI